MKTSKRITAILLGLMTLILLLPARALGLGALNTEQEASLTISSQDGDIPLVGSGLTSTLWPNRTKTVS